MAHGWWLIFDDFDVENAWAGWALFGDGELIETEDFGFSSSSIENLDKVKEAFHMENMELDLSDDPAS